MSVALGAVQPLGAGSVDGVSLAALVALLLLFEAEVLDVVEIAFFLIFVGVAKPGSCGDKKMTEIRKGIMTALCQLCLILNVVAFPVLFLVLIMIVSLSCPVSSIIRRIFSNN